MTGGQIVGMDTVQCWSAMHQPAKIFVKKSGVGQITLLGLRLAAMKGVATLLLHLALHRNLFSIWDRRLKVEHNVWLVGLQSSSGPAMTDWLLRQAHWAVRLYKFIRPFIFCSTAAKQRPDGSSCGKKTYLVLSDTSWNTSRRYSLDTWLNHQIVAERQLVSKVASLNCLSLLQTICAALLQLPGAPLSVISWLAALADAASTLLT